MCLILDLYDQRFRWTGKIQARRTSQKRRRTVWTAHYEDIHLETCVFRIHPRDSFDLFVCGMVGYPDWISGNAHDYGIGDCVGLSGCTRNA